MVECIEVDNTDTGEPDQKRVFRTFNGKPLIIARNIKVDSSEGAIRDAALIAQTLPPIPILPFKRVNLGDIRPPDTVASDIFMTFRVPRVIRKVSIEPTERSNLDENEGLMKYTVCFNIDIA